MGQASNLRNRAVSLVIEERSPCFFVVSGMAGAAGMLG